MKNPKTLLKAYVFLPFQFYSISMKMTMKSEANRFTMGLNSPMTYSFATIPKLDQARATLYILKSGYFWGHEFYMPLH